MSLFPKKVECPFKQSVQGPAILTRWVLSKLMWQNEYNIKYHNDIGLCWMFGSTFATWLYGKSTVCFSGRD